MQFLWRPRPASLLDAGTEAEILKNLKDLSKKYMEEDEAAEQGQNKELLEKRRQLMDEFKARQVSSRIHTLAYFAQVGSATGCIYGYVVGSLHAGILSGAKGAFCIGS